MASSCDLGDGESAHLELEVGGVGAHDKLRARARVGIDDWVKSFDEDAVGVGVGFGSARACMLCAHGESGVSWRV